jgi:hypothetical protein
MISSFVTTLVCGEDWPQFRGPDGAGVAPKSSEVPTMWDSRTNISWRTPMPGPGSSSPVTYRGHAYVTCYSGYGLTKESPGDIANLKRHLLCVRLADGIVEWTATVSTPEGHREHPFGSYVTTHGYASSTPAIDDNGVYVFYGTMGLVVYDHKGKQRWVASCGPSTMNFGSAASPIFYRDLVIVNADVESAAIIAFRKRDGSEAWRYSPDHEPNTWCTPIIVAVESSHELVCYGKRNQILGLNPSTGELLWTCTIPMQSYQCPSFVSHDDVVYAVGNHPGNAVAVRLGGRGDVTTTHKLWDINKGSVVSSPIYHEGHLYWAKEESTRLYCVEAATGKLKNEVRLAPSVQRMYASPVLAMGKLYFVGQTEGTYVIDATPELKLVARNIIETDDSIFNGSPAVIDDRMLLRSDTFLYCIENKQ